MELYELRQRQSLPLEAKITMSQQRIREWHEHWDGQVYVSSSGGKDSSVLLHLVRSLYPEVPAAFVDTGLEFPAIRNFVRSVENVIWLRPEKRFQEIVQEYGYPVVSKDIARSVYYARKGSNWALRRFQGQNPDGTPSQWYASRQRKWKKLLDAPFKISDKRYVLSLDEGTPAAEAGKGAKTVHRHSCGGERPANRRVSAEWL